jgi:hypothetical protein
MTFPNLQKIDENIAHKNIPAKLKTIIPTPIAIRLISTSNMVWIFLDI